jgi:hypothetical protein
VSGIGDFLFEASKDPRVKSRLQEELDSLDDASRERIALAAQAGTRMYFMADMSDLEGEEAYAIAEVHPL